MIPPGDRPVHPDWVCGTARRRRTRHGVRRHLEFGSADDGGPTDAGERKRSHRGGVHDRRLGPLSHLYHRNIDRPLFLKLTTAGIGGGVGGAYVLTELPEHIVKPAVTVYLFGMGVLILGRLIGRIAPETPRMPIVPLGISGGFLDAIRGGRCRGSATCRFSQ
jgi:hypothetical protein